MEHMGTDPVVFGLQISRRLPRSITQAIARPLSHLGRLNPACGAVALHILGRDDQLESVLEDHTRTAPVSRRDRQDRRLLTEVAVATDAPDHAFRLSSELPRNQRRMAGTLARRDWQVGEMASAVAHLQNAMLGGTATRSEHRQLLRLADERAQFHGVAPDLPLSAVSLTYRPRPKTVVHVLTNSVPHTSSGYASRSHSLLSAQAAAGWTVHAQTRPGYPAQVGKLAAADSDVVDGVTYHRISPARLPSTATGRLQLQAQELLALCLLVRPSVLHTTTHFVNGQVVRTVARALGIPWVYEVRGQLADTWASRRPAMAQSSERYRCFNAREAEVMGEADDVAALGGAMAQHIENITRGEVPAGAVRFAPNAVGPDYERPLEDRASVRERLELRALGIGRSEFLVGTVTSVVDYEGLDDLIRASSEWPPGVRTVIVGDGAARPGLEHLAQRLGLADRVSFVGRVSAAEARDWQRALDVFVAPRQDRPVTRSVTPLKVIEAAACGTPVVASRLPAMQESVTHGVTGLLVPPENPDTFADAVLRLWADRGMSLKLGEAARQAVLEHRTWSAVAAHTLARYEQLVRAAEQEDDKIQIRRSS